jgi:hypothetical protein
VLVIFLSKKKKYEATIVLPGRDKIISFEQVLKNVFWKDARLASSEENSAIAEKVLKMIRGRGLSAKEFKKHMVDLNVSFSRYYLIVGRLRAVGMIYKKDGEYLLSDGFALRCQESADIWRAFCEVTECER